MTTATHAVAFETWSENKLEDVCKGRFQATSLKGRLENVDNVLHY